MLSGDFGETQQVTSEFSYYYFCWILNKEKNNEKEALTK